MGKVRVLVLLALLVVSGHCFTEEEGEAEQIDSIVSHQDDEDVSCSQYCDGTYPEHTYPDPEDHSACARGCRLAVMDALIAWPFSPAPSSCLATCEEAYYGSERQCFACKVGCNATTIDQRVPNRDHIYQTNMTTDTEFGFVMEVFEVFRSQLPQFVMFTDDMSELNDHADKMYQLLPCSSSSTFIYLDDEGGVIEIQYGYNNAPGVVYPDDMFYNEEDNEGAASYYISSCPWQNSATGRLIFLLVSVTLVAVVISVCCCTTGSTPEQPNKVSVELCSNEVNGLKSPLSFTAGYPQPVPYYEDKKKNVHY